MADISIVMPLYNAEKYLREALESVLRQTYRDFELICVNDASTDATMEILQQFQARDNRIRILTNEERSGAAISRNKGLREVKGKYLTFLDGDDIFEEEMLERAHQAIEEKKADIVVYEYAHAPSENIYEKRSRKRSRKFVEKYCKDCFSARKSEPIDMVNWGGAPYKQLYRSNFIFENKLEFQTLSCSNDVYFVGMAAFLTDKMLMLDDRRIMVYARDHNVPTRISIDRDPMCAYWALEKLEKELINRDILRLSYRQFYSLLFFSLRGALMHTKTEKKAEEFYAFLQNEGIEKFFVLDGIYYHKLESYIRQPLENFLTLDFSSKWYLDETSFLYYLRKERETVMAFFEKRKNSRDRIAVWGAGKRGKILLDFLNQNQIKVDVVVDKSAEKQGQTIAGYRIEDPASILEQVKMIVVASNAVYEDVCGEVAGKDIEVVNIAELVSGGSL